MQLVQPLDLLLLPLLQYRHRLLLLLLNPFMLAQFDLFERGKLAPLLLLKLRESLFQLWKREGSGYASRS